MIFTRGFSRLDRRVASRRSLLSTKNKEQRGSNAVGRGTWEHSLGQEEKEDTLKRCTPTPVCFVATELRSHGATEPRSHGAQLSTTQRSAPLSARRLVSVAPNLASRPGLPFPAVATRGSLEA